MALVEYGALITAFRGSIGGITFHSNRAGKIARLRPSGRKSFTPLQSEQHAELQRYIVEWHSLTQELKELWNDYADTYTKTDRWGDVRTVTGFNFFFLINYNRVLVGETVLTSPPVHTVPNSPAAYTFKPETTKLELSFLVDFIRPGESLVIFTTPPLSQSSTSWRSQLRQTYISNAGTWGDINLTAYWVATHGLLYPPDSVDDVFTIGVAAKMINQNTGLDSPYVVQTSGFPYVPGGISYWIIEYDFIVQ